MKIKHLFFSLSVLVVAASLILTGCRKHKEKDDDTSGVQDNALAEGSFNDIGQISDEASKGSVSSYKDISSVGILSACASVKFDTLNHADKDSITVTFGDANGNNCLCNDNRYRRGKLYIEYTAGKHYWDSTADVTIRTAPTDNYFVNDNQVKGTKNIHNNGHNSAHHLNWSINVNGTIVKANGQGTLLWTSSRNREWISGEITPLNWTDDIYSITGSANGTSVAGNNFTAQIDASDPLIKKNNCWWISAGKFSFDPGNGKPVRYVDFGYSPNQSGSCDNWASITINGNTYHKQF